MRAFNINQEVKFGRHFVLVMLLLTIISTSCKKLIQVPPPTTEISSADVYSTDAAAAAVLTGIYTTLSASDQSISGITSMFFYPGLSVDELTLYQTNSQQYLLYYTNNLTSANTGGVDFWESTYPIIYEANAAISGLTGNASLTTSVDQQLLGEAKFIRAFCYFYLVNLYGGVPVVTSTDYKANALLARSTTAQVYQQIIQDLTSAQALLSANYLQSDAETSYTIGNAQRVRPTKWAAEALLARVYLYTANYGSAVSMADSVINNTTYYSLDALNAVFLANSTETIWALQPVNTSPSANTGEGAIFILPPTGPNTTNSFPVSLSNNLLNAFEANDLRRTNWVDSVIVGSNIYYYAYKYEAGIGTETTTEYSIVLRLAELYLVRAEAEANLGDSTDAIADLNVIRSRAQLAGYDATVNGPLLAAILHERQVEFFTEWGHRWFDLKRTGNINAVMSQPPVGAGVCAQKGGTWSMNWQWYPIALSELETDPSLTQNQGY